MNVLLFALGSHGDVHPLVGVGIRLLATPKPADGLHREGRAMTPPPPGAADDEK